MGDVADIVGRMSERAHLAESIELSGRGDPTALLLSGEAGVGKTSLVTAVTEAYAATGHLVLWGRCLRFAADSTPYLPIGQLLTQWHRQADPAERARVLAGADDLAAIAPELATGAPGRTEPGHLLRLASAAIDRIAETTPTVLVVDDLQWADTTSLDLLAYLVAGFTPGQRLCVIGTYRDTDLGTGHRLHGWLGDLRRLPSVDTLPMARLGLPETEELVGRLWGPDGSTLLGAELFARTGGNPYLVEVLSRAGAASADQGLEQVLLGSWHRLGGPTRQLLQLLALGGRPVARPVLAELAAARGLAADAVGPAISEALDDGIATFVTGGHVWFHHPLLAEVIATTLSLDEQVRVHREYVRVWEAATDLPLAARAAHLALHHEAAGDADAAYTWSVRAADAAAVVRGFAEEAQHLHRACRLWPETAKGTRGTEQGRVALLARTSERAMRAGEYRLALDLREEALALVDQVEEPLVAARLLFLVPLLRDHCGVESFMDVATMREMVALTEGHPDSPEHAIALAQLALGEVWAGMPTAREHAEEAVRRAGLLESVEARTWAHGVRAETSWGTLEGVADAELAVELARGSGDALLIAHAARWRSNSLDSLGRIAEAADATYALFQELVSEGSFYEAVEFAPLVGFQLIELGRWREARQLTREVLSRRLQSRWGATARSVAADLAWRSGDVAAAEQHLARAGELNPMQQPVGNLALHVVVHVALAAGDPDRALSLVEEALPPTLAVDDNAADELLIWATRAASELAEQPGRRATVLARIDRLDRERGHQPPRFGATDPQDKVHRALGAVYVAERARLDRDREALPGAWRSAAAACADAGLPWEEALARFRLAQALLGGRAGRREAGTALRDALHIAGDLGAAPLRDDVEALARDARISLAEPSVPAVGALLPGLTRREDEVLGHVVAGRTYGEIAAALFISEKTVSVHVSNLLRKTGTSSRIEVAELARRTSEGSITPTARADRRP